MFCVFDLQHQPYAQESKASLCGLPYQTYLDRFKAPTLEGSKTMVHAEQVAGKQAGLVASCACPHLHNDIPVIGFIFGEQLQQDALLQS